MPVREALWLLAGKGHYKASSAVGQPHHKDLHRLLDSPDDGDGFSPIHLRILARLKLQRQEERRGRVGLVPLAHMQTDSRFTALVALCLEQFIDLVTGVLLLARQMYIFGQQFVGSCSKGPEHWGWLRFAESVRLWRLIVDRLIHGFARMLVFAGDLPLTLAFQVVGPPNGFAFFHGNHLQCSYR